MPVVSTFVPKPLPRADLGWRALVPSIGRATLALARYDGILHGVPDPAAVLSSKIEGTQATLGDVLRFEAGEPARDEDRREDIHEILNYRRALRETERALSKGRFSLDLMKRLHAILLASVRGRDRSPGEFRCTRVWIGAPGAPIEAARFVPPEPAPLPNTSCSAISYA